MNTVTLHFKADNQQLTALDGLYKLASNTVEYVKAIFTLGENWTGFDVVRAAWYTDFECISTVLDGNGECFVPWEVLSRPEGVTLNLYGCDLEEESDGESVLIDRLTTYPVKAILVDVDARVCGSETKPVTPSQFEQYIAIVQELVGTVRDITSCVLNPDYTLTINYSDGTSDTVGPIRGEQGATGATGNGISSVTKISSSGTNPVVDTYRITYTNGNHTDFTVTNGVKGDTGATGNGIESVYLTATHGAVKTYTILFTDGTTYDFDVTDGEVTLAQLESVLPTDTASGAIASFPDGSDLFDYLSCVVNIEPVQAGSGTPSPDNVRPITGWTGCEVDQLGKNWFGGISTVLNGYIPSSGVITADNNNRTVICEVLPNTKYTISFTRTAITGADDWQVAEYETTPQIGSTGTRVVAQSMTTSNATITTGASTHYLAVKLANINNTNFDATKATLQIELGQTSTDYTPYNGTTYNITWQIEAGTVYGGWVSIIDGKIYPWLEYDMGDLNWTLTDGSSPTLKRFKSGVQTIPVSGNIVPTDVMCEWYGCNKWNDLSTTSPMGIYVHGTSGEIFVRDTDYATASDFQTAVSGVKLICIPQSYTPIDITATPIPCLLGQNNVFANCGNIEEVQYKADVQRYIEKMLNS